MNINIKPQQENEEFLRLLHDDLMEDDNFTDDWLKIKKDFIKNSCCC